ncbi:hypothetical protein GCM10008929_14350 [Alkalibacterium psychrotolerans]
MNKNKLMMVLGTITLSLTLLVQYLHQFSVINSHNHGSEVAMTSTLPPYFNMVNALFLSIPVSLLLTAFLLMRVSNNHRLLPVLITLLLTFSVISMIMGGFGAVEYHFGIFMVIATMAYYNSVKLVSLMTGTFAFQHLLGYFYPPATVFVYGSGTYSFTMVLIHAVFLVLTAGAVIWQILANQKQVATLEAMNEASERTIQSIIEQLTDTSSQVELTAQQLTENASQTQTSSQEVKGSILSIRKGANDQVQQAQNSQKVLDSFSLSIEEIEKNTSNIVNSSKLMKKESTEGFALVNQTTDEMNKLEASFNHVRDIVETLDSQSKEINSIITVISDISEKTNLLALNAAIEAAQAGSAGKGFAVVADEVRKLSIQTDEAVRQVGNIIKTIQTESGEAKESVNNGQHKMIDSLHSVSETELKFKYIIDAVNSLDEDIHQTALTSESISQGADSILKALDRMQSIAEQTSTITDTTDSQSEKQLELIKNTTHIADLLMIEVEKLTPLITKLRNNKLTTIEQKIDKGQSLFPISSVTQTV